MIQSTLSVGLLLLITIVASTMLLVSVEATAFHVQKQHMATMSTQHTTNSLMDTIESIRAGASDDDDSEDEYDDEYDSDEEEEEDIKLSASAVKAMKKSKSKKSRDVKSKVSKSLSSATATTTTTKKKKAGLSSKIPYVIKAFMNPFTVLLMTKGYFASLFNIDYLKKEASETLRSALQEKAKSASASTGRGKRARKMKPGQAKTLSDLPVINA